MYIWQSNMVHCPQLLFHRKMPGPENEAVVVLLFFPPGKVPAQTFQTGLKILGLSHSLLRNLTACISSRTRELLLHQARTAASWPETISISRCFHSLLLLWRAPSASLIPLTSAASPNPGKDRRAGKAAWLTSQ